MGGKFFLPPGGATGGGRFLKPQGGQWGADFLRYPYFWGGAGRGSRTGLGQACKDHTLRKHVKSSGSQLLKSGDWM